MRYLTFLSLLLCLNFSSVSAQQGRSLPESTQQNDWHLPVSDVHTTTLIFPHDVISVDRGTSDVLTQTLDEVTNIVKVKSASQLMEPSSLTVITSGGMVYTFRVSYDLTPTTLTYHLAPLRAFGGVLPPAYTPKAKSITPINYTPGQSGANYYGGMIQNAVYMPPAPAAAPLELGTRIDMGVDSFSNPMNINYGRTVLNTRTMWNTSSYIHKFAQSKRVAKDKQPGSELKLNDIWIDGDIMYYRFTLDCLSDITYDIDFWRFYVVDSKQRKRTAVQERDVDLIHVYTPGENANRISSRGTRTFVVAVNKFTIPDKKNLVLEVFEHNGGRHHQLKVKNKDIVKAKLVPEYSPTQVR